MINILFDHQNKHQHNTQFKYYINFWIAGWDVSSGVGNNDDDGGGGSAGDVVCEEYAIFSGNLQVVK